MFRHLKVRLILSLQFIMVGICCKSPFPYYCIERFPGHIVTGKPDDILFNLCWGGGERLQEIVSAFQIAPKAHEGLPFFCRPFEKHTASNKWICVQTSSLQKIKPRCCNNVGELTNLPVKRTHISRWNLCNPRLLISSMCLSLIS